MTAKEFVHNDTFMTAFNAFRNILLKINIRFIEINDQFFTFLLLLCNTFKLVGCDTVERAHHMV